MLLQFVKRKMQIYARRAENAPPALRRDVRIIGRRAQEKSVRAQEEDQHEGVEHDGRPRRVEAQVKIPEAVQQDGDDGAAQQIIPLLPPQAARFRGPDRRPCRPQRKSGPARTEAPA